METAAPEAFPNPSLAVSVRVSSRCTAHRSILHTPYQTAIRRPAASHCHSPPCATDGCGIVHREYLADRCRPWRWSRCRGGDPLLRFPRRRDRNCVSCSRAARGADPPLGSASGKPDVAMRRRNTATAARRCRFPRGGTGPVWARSAERAGPGGSSHKRRSAPRLHDASTEKHSRRHGGRRSRDFSAFFRRY